MGFERELAWDWISRRASRYSKDLLATNFRRLIDSSLSSPCMVALRLRSSRTSEQCLALVFEPIKESDSTPSKPSEGDGNSDSVSTLEFHHFSLSRDPHLIQNISWLSANVAMGGRRKMCDHPIQLHREYAIWTKKGNRATADTLAFIMS